MGALLSREKARGYIVPLSRGIASRVKLGLTLRLELGLMLGDAALYGRLGLLHRSEAFSGFLPRPIAVRVDSHVRFNKCYTAHSATVLRQWR